MEKSSNVSTQSVLNAIFPPAKLSQPTKDSLLQNSIIHTNDGNLQMSPQPSSRDEVITLQRKLDALLQERQARESGLCDIRSFLYSHCFDEVLRQITVECPERGLLLSRVRNEIQMTIAAYSTLYANSLSFGLRKSVAAETGINDLETDLESKEAEKKRIEEQIKEAKFMYESIERRQEEKRKNEEKKWREEKEFLKYQAAHLESFLKSTQ